jgi:peptidoglycan/xylan/chitin deacetylase (PgdA/CDA1 family)
MEGGAILKAFGVTGTYYVSLGLAGKQVPPGAMFLRDDLHTVLAQGHELGCHTFSHCHSWNTRPAAFERSILQNRLALGEILPGVSFRTFSYPISTPRPATKRRVAKYFECCRGGDQTSNVGTADLNFLRAFFLEQARENPEPVKRIIDSNCTGKGWLIFATHDISKSPSPYGCTPRFFETIARYASDSGARILPVARARQVLCDRCGVLRANEPQL